MTSHRFTVNVPNPTAKRASVELRLEPATRRDLSSLPRDLPKGVLEVEGAGLTLDPCSEDAKPRLKLELAPFASVDVHVVVNTATSRKSGVAGFHLVDRRHGDDVGGVYLVCAVPPFVEGAGGAVPTPNPCPATLARDPYLMPIGGNPRKPPRARPSLPGDSLELVAPVTNLTGQTLRDTQVYLEHLGASGVEFSPGTWNIGSLDKGEVFYATWPVHTAAGHIGSFDTSVVVASEGLDPVRLKGKVSLAIRGT